MSVGFSPTIIEALDAPLDPARVATRSGAGSKGLSYLEGYDVIDSANKIFGYDGWSHELLEIRREDTVVIARVVVTLHPRDESTGLTAIVGRHGDTGIGTITGDKTESIEKGYKEAVTDGMKRCLRALGNQFGNPLYDKHSELHASNDSAQAPRSTSTSRTPTTRAPQAAAAPATAPAAPSTPPAGDGAAVICEDCQAEITASAKYTAARRAEFSRKANDGRVLCFKCQTAYQAAKSAA